MKVLSKWPPKARLYVQKRSRRTWRSGEFKLGLDTIRYLKILSYDASVVVIMMVVMNVMIVMIGAVAAVAVVLMIMYPMSRTRGPRRRSDF